MNWIHLGVSEFISFFFLRESEFISCLLLSHQGEIRTQKYAKIMKRKEWTLKSVGNKK